MHSSRMCTARLLPVSPSMHCAGGRVSPPGGCVCLSSQGEVGVCLWSAGVCLLSQGCIQASTGADTPHPVDKQTLVKTQPSQTSFAGGNNVKYTFIITSPFHSLPVFLFSIIYKSKSNYRHDLRLHKETKT